MSEVVQWIIVGLLLAVSLVYLAKRLIPRKKSAGCCSGCASCPLGPEFARQCAESKETTPPRAA